MRREKRALIAHDRASDRKNIPAAQIRNERQRKFEGNASEKDWR